LVIESSSEKTDSQFKIQKLTIEKDAESAPPNALYRASCRMLLGFCRFPFNGLRLFNYINSTFGTSGETRAAVSAAFLPDAVRRKAGFVGKFFLAFHRKILTCFPAFVAHRTTRTVDGEGYESRAITVRASALNVLFKYRGMIFQKSCKNVSVILALLAHSAVLYLNGNSLKQRNMRKGPFACLDHFQDFNRII
jgi:hypothetical protein